MANDYMMGLVSKGGRFIVGAIIKSIQQLKITIDAGETVEAVTISEVVMANTVLIFAGFHVAVNTSDAYPRIELTDTTTVTANRGPATTYPCYMTATVVEFEAGGIKSIQRDTIAFVTPEHINTATISEVDITKAVILFLGAQCTFAGKSAECRVELTNSTTVTTLGVESGGTTIVGFEVLELP